MAEIFLRQCSKKGIITRPMPEKLGNYLRISIGTEIENEKVMAALKEVLPKLHRK